LSYPVNKQTNRLTALKTEPRQSNGGKAGVKCAAHGSLEIQDAKSPFWHHSTNLSGYIFGTKASIDNRKKNLLSAIPPPHVLIIWWTSAY